MSETCSNPACDCHLSVMELAAKRGFCICFGAIIPDSRQARPSMNCPRHKTLAQRWDQVKTIDDFNAALLADHKPEWGKFRPLTASGFTESEKRALVSIASVFDNPPPPQLREG